MAATIDVLDPANPTRVLLSASNPSGALEADILSDPRDKSGFSADDLMVEGKTWTGSANSEERYSDELVRLIVEALGR